MSSVADDNLYLHENDGTFQKRLENTVGKGKIACYEQFVLFPTVFLKDLYCRYVKTRACLGRVYKGSANKAVPDKPCLY